MDTIEVEIGTLLIEFQGAIRYFDGVPTGVDDEGGLMEDVKQVVLEIREGAATDVRTGLTLDIPPGLWRLTPSQVVFLGDFDEEEAEAQ